MPGRKLITSYSNLQFPLVEAGIGELFSKEGESFQIHLSDFFILNEIFLFVYLLRFLRDNDDFKTFKVLIKIFKVLIKVSLVLISNNIKKVFSKKHYNSWGEL